MVDFGFYWKGAGIWLRGLMEGLDPVFGLLEGPEIAIGLCLFMLAVAFCVFAWMIVKVQLVRRRLDQSTKFIKKHNESYPAFKNAFRKISGEINALKPLRHSWREFKETLVIEEDSDDVPVGNSIRPQQYLNVHAVEASGKSFRLLQSLPNYFVGFGLLFTFIGLVAAIYTVEDRTPRVYPWMNESGGGMLGIWKYDYLRIAPIVCSTTLFGCANIAVGS